MDRYTYNPGEAAWEELLVGRRIVAVDQYSDMSATLTLDDGQRVRVRANEGCGGCSNGYYYIAHIVTVDNMIMGVRCETEPREGDYYEESYIYRVYVFTTNAEIEALTVEGDDGNGYYGTGYSLEILED